MDFTHALTSLYPGCTWEMYGSGSEYEGLVWKDENVPKPSVEELTAECEKINRERPLKQLRVERNKRIAQTDYLAIPDYPHPTEEVKQAWLDYRQSLRDLPANTTDPKNPVWPTAPN